MSTEFKQLLKTQQLDSALVRERTREIYERSLSESRHMTSGNFTAFHAEDLDRLFNLYDDTFFSGECKRLLEDSPLEFRISRRMTSAGGKTTRVTRRRPKKNQPKQSFEIAVSSTLLFQTFHDVDRSISVTGIECKDRFEALQRVFEHELVHLLEMLLWKDSSCSRPRFQQIASRWFAHAEHTHQLITPRERALAKFGIQAGDHVCFVFEGQRYQGFVNRITKRATVLVQDPTGTRYSDGHSYRKFYVPVELLQRMPG